MPDAAMPPPIEIRHDEAASRFETVGEGEPSVLEYERKAGKMIFTHTYVPPAMRSLGLAAELVKRGFAYARQEGLRVVPLCSYVAHYLTRHPEYEDLR